ncbi:MAG: hypothetical protein ACE5Q6_17570 [Dehalococcoidia bacterium]
MSPAGLLDGCLEMLGGYLLEGDTRALLLEHLEKHGELKTGTEEFAGLVGQTLQLIVSTQEYQFA